MTSPEKVRVLVVGDSGVGKTSLTCLIARDTCISSPAWTVGCSVEVKLHQYLEGTQHEKEYFVELWDIGGSHSQRNTRHVYMHVVHGIILVHDLTNRKSCLNLEKWLAEVMRAEAGSTMYSGAWDGANNDVGEVSIPLLVVGTKVDEANGSRLPLHNRRSDIAEEYATEEIHLNCNDKTSIGPGTSAATKLARFFDKVIARQFYSSTRRPSVSTSLYQERRQRTPAVDKNNIMMDNYFMTGYHGPSSVS